MTEENKQKKTYKRSRLRKKLTVATVLNYFVLGTCIMIVVVALFFVNVVRNRYSDNVDIAKTIEDTVISQIDITNLVGAVLQQVREDPDAFRKKVFVTEASESEGQLLSYQWFTEENPPLAKRADYQSVVDMLYAFNSNNKNLNGTSLMVFDKTTHIACLMCDVEKFGSDTPSRVDYIMWRNFADEDLENIEKERWSLMKNLIRYMRVNMRYMTFIWYEPVEYEDENVVVFVETDVFYNRLLAGVLSLIVLSILLILFVVLILGFFHYLRINKLIFNPVNAISAAAKSYVEDHLSGNKGHTHFSSLNIHSGDEFEALVRTMDEMERDIDQFEEDLTLAAAERERISAELSRIS